MGKSKPKKVNHVFMRERIEKIKSIATKYDWEVVRHDEELYQIDFVKHINNIRNRINLYAKSMTYSFVECINPKINTHFWRKKATLEDLERTMAEGANYIVGSYIRKGVPITELKAEKKEVVKETMQEFLNSL